MSRLSDMCVAHEEDDGSVTVHADSECCPNDHSTLCGMDLHSDDNGLEGPEQVPVPPGAIINCSECIQLIMSARRFRRTDYIYVPRGSRND